jgi:hypothetical protein
MHPFLNRRDFLARTSTGLGGIALAHLLATDRARAAPPIRPRILPGNPNALRPPHFEAKAKRVLMIFCSGAVSQIDTFDYKPELIKRHGQPMPGGDKIITFQGGQGNLTKSPWEFRPYGKTGKMVSDLVPHLGALADEMCFIHSLTGKTNTHGPGENFLTSGSTLDGFPSMGAWTTYAMGSENDTLPAYVAIPDPRGAPQSAGNFWGAGFLPAAFQGTDFNASKPLRNLERPSVFSPETDRATREFIELLNRRHLEKFPGDSELAARISSYELAARMQLSVPEVADLSTEPAHVLKMYGADEAGNPVKETKAAYARNCILARRLIEKGVRFVQLFHQGWDQHGGLPGGIKRQCQQTDQASAALIKDLKQRGLLEDTLVIWGGEFGRTAYSQGKITKDNYGRDHHPRCFSLWMAGGGVKGGQAHGQTDEFGYNIVKDPVHVHDLHATMLHLLGVDHERQTFKFQGRYYRLTDVAGHVVKAVVA